MGDKTTLKLASSLKLQKKKLLDIYVNFFQGKKKYISLLKVTITPISARGCGEICLTSASIYCF